MSNAREQELELQLSAIIGKHADWLDGPTWMQITERIGRGHFNDLPEMFDAMGALDEIAERLQHE